MTRRRYVLTESEERALASWLPRLIARDGRTETNDPISG